MKKKSKNFDKINNVLEEAINLYKRIKYKEAKELFYQALEDDPVNPEAHYYLGLIFSKEENWKKSIIHIKTIVDAGINFIFTQQCRMILGIIYFKNKEFKRAELEFIEALKLDNDNVQIHAALACVYHYLKEKNNAIDFAKKAFSLDPFNLNVKNTYGYLLSDYNIDVQKSIEILREIVRVKPDNSSYLDSLGWAYYKKGDYFAALASIEEALKHSKSHEIKHHYEIINKALSGKTKGD